MVIFEPAHGKIYNKTCATSEDSDQTARMRSLISVFADRMCLLQPVCIQRGINENRCRTGWMDRLIRDFSGYTGLIVGFRVLAHFIYYSTFVT